MPPPSAGVFFEVDCKMNLSTILYHVGLLVFVGGGFFVVGFLAGFQHARGTFIPKIAAMIDALNRTRAALDKANDELEKRRGK